MDTIAALNFGLVIVIIINNFGIKEDKNVVKHIVIAGIIAGTILTLVYSMLTAIGSASSSIYEGMENGALILRQMMFDLLGGFGALLLAAIFTLACITTCVGLTNSISKGFKSILGAL